MNRRKPEQIVHLLHKADEELAKGKAVEDICREEQISPATYYRCNGSRVVCKWKTPNGSKPWKSRTLN